MSSATLADTDEPN